MDSTTQVTLTLEELREAMLTRRDFNVFCAFAAPQAYRLTYPPVYQALWQELTDSLLAGKAPHIHDKYAISGSRGFIKTFLLKMLAVFAFLFTERRSCVVVCSEESKAKDFVDDVWQTLLSDNITAAFGTFDISTDTKTLKIFDMGGIRRSLMPFGAGQSLRGTQVDFQRPDFLILDDLLDLEDTDTDLKYTRLKRWLYATALEALNKFNSVTVYLGNMYPKNCLTTFLVNSDNWKSLRLCPILADGSLLWPEMLPLKVLQEKFRAAEKDGTLDMFYSEVLNMPIGSTEGMLDFSAIQPLDDSWWTRTFNLGSFVVIDPAGNKTTSDANAIGYFELHQDEMGREYPCMKHVVEDNLDPKQVITEALKLCFDNGCRTLFVEGVAYQSTLGFWLGEAIKNLGLSLEDFQIILIQPERTSKNGRILGLLKSLIRGSAKIGKLCYPLIMARAKAWDISSTKNKDDVLDLIYYALRIAKEHRDKLKPNVELRMNAMESAASTEAALAVLDTDYV